MDGEDEQLELEAYRVNRPAQTAMSMIHRILDGSTIYDYAYAVRTRIKPVDKIVAKVWRKRRDEHRTGYLPTDITDLLGVRFVFLFRDDLVNALRVLLEMFNRTSPYETAPFARGTLHEAIYYTVQRAGDPEDLEGRIREELRRSAIVIRSMDKGSLGEFEVKTKDTRYSSLHLVTYCEVNEKGKMLRVPVEIQLRTVFEDAWGEVDHKLRYSLGRAKDQGHLDQATLQEKLASWEPHLFALKSYLDTCALHAGLIRAQALVQRSTHYYRGPLRPIESFDDVAKRIGEMPAEIEAALRAAYRHKDESEAMPEGRERQTGIATAAAEFRALRDLVRKIDGELDLTSADAITYFSQMEEAYCYLLLGSTEQLERAISIYRELERSKTRPDPTLSFRLGGALADKGDLEGAASCLAEAAQGLEKSEEFAADHVLRIDVPKRRGFVEWTRANEAIEPATQIECLRRAYAYTRETPSESLFIVNNKLYYLVEYFDAKGPEDAMAHLTREEVARLYGVVEERLPEAADRRLSIIHTLARAGVSLNLVTQAKRYAEEIVSVLDGRYAQGETPAARADSMAERLPAQFRRVWEFALFALRLPSPAQPPGSRDDPQRPAP